jgi:4,5-DOPA dioxygenase extradiol
MTDKAPSPALFIGHGTPMNALGGHYADQWRALGARLRKPKAVLVVSAHWETHGLAATAQARPPTIHDFGGFPAELFAMQYPAPGSPELVARLQALFAPNPVAASEQWGLDHGAWSVLAHLFPEADVPVVQFGLDLRLPEATHLAIGRRLSALRDEGVMILCTGNIVHNLRVLKRDPDAPAYPWAERFDTAIRRAIEARDLEALADWRALGEDARLSVPRPEHYLPLLYAAGAAREDDALEILTPEIALASASMTSVLYGTA